MDKPKIKWKPVKMPNPADRENGAPIFVPRITDRDSAVSLAEVVADAIDRSLIVGMKREAAESVANGILTQLGKVLNAGKSVIFGDYFRTALMLEGTVDSMIDSLDSDNSLKVSIIPGKAYKLDRENFAFENVYVAGETPELAAVLSEDDAMGEGELQTDAHTILQGKHLALDFAKSDYVAFWNVTEDGSRGTICHRFEAAADFATNKSTLLQVNTNRGSSDLRTSAYYFVQVVKHQIVNGESVNDES
ncbi:MAG: hypothetical protein IJ829_00135, partial [Kiritimatiellae bacterium]|nr:hypothetical protein [Kiritimatiellia bacterium]